MTRHILRIPWAGPAVALALLFSTVDARPAAGATAKESVRAAAAVPTATAGIFCLNESYEFGKALGEWVNAWQEYQLTLPGGTPSEIQAAVDKLNQATAKVVDTGVRLVGCLVRYLE